ncbi:MAG: 3-oxoacyl-[acyl-carrier-protein] synthase [Solirubrobacteraceae bacterium]|nr:3-oxoacyl-[acyl-carrier-protein] synthase [Solirubrobacteraceae bacterium]
MRSATLPPDLRTIAREATRTGHPVVAGRAATVIGLGHWVPAEVVPNGALTGRLGVDDHWIVKRTGVHTRRRAAPTDRVSDMATWAGRRALNDAGVEPYDLDLVLVATMTSDEITPNTAPLVAHALGAERAGAIDIGAACSGWLAALRLAAGQIETGRAERVLVIGAEALTRLLDYDDLKTAHLFGDGAGAVVLGPGTPPQGETPRGAAPGHIGPIVLAADGALGGAITCDHDERKIRMDGHSTYQTAVKRLSEATVAAVARAGLELEDIDLFVYHQANGRIIRAVGERLDLDPPKVADYVAHMANTSAASIPLTLSLLREDNRLREGQKVLVSAIGAGFTWGAGVVEWGSA